jgi:cell division septation protein DedD
MPLMATEIRVTPAHRRVTNAIRIAILTVAMTVVARAVPAQDVGAGDSAVFARAQVLVSAGEGKEGRAVVDSLLSRIPTGSLRYAEGLFWRATLASNALDAERDYRRIAVEYVLSPRVPAALTRLAQLELARGDRTLARQHLERLLNEYPPRDARADAWYWLGRIAFESGDATRGCAAIDSARSLAGVENVELTNQIASDARRCVSRPDGSLVSASPSVEVTRPVAAPAGPAPAAAVTKASPAGQVTIQVGAYPTRASADKVRKRLTAQGFRARVVPAGRYYRVRVGRYPTRASAAPVVKKLKSRHYDTMVTDAEPAP